ncbi:MAG: PilZ domain-containing protein [Bdellovibrionaceae bacterium]|nr:PilZ domain-containing protein [Pseudobdellovibrionaceae bacterium]MBX3032573.1 PilZ domain-containing protein [Pseudobdellovibrionaceae bacterium]
MSAHRYQTAELVHIEIYGRMGRALARMKNLSSTGAFLELSNGEYVPRKGDLMKATVHLHSLGRSRAVDAEVIWSNGLGFGVSFLKKTELLERMFQKPAST